MIASAAALLALSSLQDRSGLDRLKECLRGLAAEPTRAWTITRFEQAGSGDAETREASLDFWRGPGSSFRANGATVWGDSMLAVSDGKTLLTDPLDGVSPAMLRPAGDTLAQAWTRADIEASFALFPRLLAGEAAASWVAPEQGSVEARPVGQGGWLIRTKGSRMGSLMLVFGRAPGGFVLQELRRGLGSQPGGGGFFFGASRIREVVQRLAPQRLPRDWFSPTPANGQPVRDMRQAGAEL